jgi:hypothetical protein
VTIFFPQYIHLINYISFSAGEHVSATTAKVMKEKTMSGDGHVKAMLYNKLEELSTVEVTVKYVRFR